MMVPVREERGANVGYNLNQAHLRHVPKTPVDERILHSQYQYQQSMCKGETREVYEQGYSSFNHIVKSCKRPYIEDQHYTWTPKRPRYITYHTNFNHTQHQSTSNQSPEEVDRIIEVNAPSMLVDQSVNLKHTLTPRKIYFNHVDNQVITHHNGMRPHQAVDSSSNCRSEYVSSVQSRTPIRSQYSHPERIMLSPSHTYQGHALQLNTSPVNTNKWEQEQISRITTVHRNNHNPKNVDSPTLINHRIAKSNQNQNQNQSALICKKEIRNPPNIEAIYKPVDKTANQDRMSDIDRMFVSCPGTISLDATVKPNYMYQMKVNPVFRRNSSRNGLEKVQAESRNLSTQYRESCSTLTNTNKSDSSTLPKQMLLALPEDKSVLSESLCLIRENVEVFCATIDDLNAPAPGRKNPIGIGQVGIRCIHCKFRSNRVKRATCYPSSIIRIYRTVTDMKLDHFDACPEVPIDIKRRLDALKTINTRSTIATMRYFVDSAKKLGLMDTTANGIRMAHVNVRRVVMPYPTRSEVISDNESTSNSSVTNYHNVHNVYTQREDSIPTPPPAEILCRPISSQSAQFNDKPTYLPVSSEHSMPNTISRMISTDASCSSEFSHSQSSKDDSDMSICYPITQQRSHHTNSKKVFNGRVLLALPEDKFSLSPLRCFLREHIYAFSASAEDIAVRTPTSFSVALGQVGIACIHCYSLPKDRSNRAICFPFSIGRIYQSVADMQRFHFSNCKRVPKSLRSKFLSLQSASSKGSKGLATRQYWVTAAKKLGLVDTPNGIRFNRDPNTPFSSIRSLDILAQVASNVMTNDPLVLPEDKPLIADFLYMVMEQLQRCRFTEADRNKRRLKDVGYIGVECKHCSRQVDGRKFFWSSVNAVESNFVSVHTHMMKCRMVPEDIKIKLESAKKLRKEQTARLQTGSQKAFFARVWKRLHSKGCMPDD